MPKPQAVRLELGVVVALLVLAGGLLGFVSLATEMSEGDTHAFDQAILLALRQPGDSSLPIGPAWLEGSMKDITALGGFTVLTLITLFAVAYLVMDRKRAAAALLGVSVVGGTLLGTVLKQGFDRPRPELVAHLVDVHSLSFPSGHAMMSAVTYLTIGVLLARTSPRRRIKAYLIGVAVLLTLMIGFSRIYLGVHWPTDVLAGWCVGAAWAILCWLLARMLQKRGQVEPAAPAPADAPDPEAGAAPADRPAPAGDDAPRLGSVS